MTGLLYAIFIGSLQTVRMLVAAGANMSPSLSCGIRRTPLQAAVEAGRVEIVQFLLEQGVDPNEPPAVSMGATCLQLAAIKGFVGIATTLLDKGAAINAEPALMQGRTAFEGATEHGRIEMMILLFQNGADLLSNNRRQHERAIEFAEKNRNYAAVQLAGELLQEAVNQERTYLWKEMGAEMPGIDIEAVDTSFHRD
jgi:ankyrin repeat protein